VFDIYGTLLVSAAGEISHDVAGDSEEEGTRLRHAIRRHRDAALAAGEEVPEVDIRDMWREVLGTDAGTATRRALAWEVEQNPVWPMPGAAELVRHLAARGLQLGIVSNAQFYTPWCLATLLSQVPWAEWCPPAWCGWSWQEQAAKPSLTIFRPVEAAVAAAGLHPEQVLYVGNDLRNDVYGARRVGWKAALFAGDARSLRWREDDPAMSGVRPDAVVTELGQVAELLP
jgi:putative hydrolase of the HAD superfamily